MPIDIPKGTREKLTECFANSIYEGSFVDGELRPSWAYHEGFNLSPGTKWELALRAIIDEWPALTFFFESARTCGFACESNSPFSENFSRSDALAAASRIAERLQSLPWTYYSITELPILFASPDFEPLQRDFKNGIAIVSGQQLAAEAIELPPEQSIILGSIPRRWKTNGIYLKISATGFIQRNGSTETTARIEDDICSLLGILVASGAISIAEKWYSSLAGPRPDLDPNIWHFLNEQHTPCGRSMLDDLHRDAMKYMLRKKSENNDDPDNALAIIENAITNFYSYTPRLRSAARWYLESHLGGSPQLKFVQITVALEVLLGDQKTAREAGGLSMLMANRCAYMLGNDEEDRVRLIELFRSGYGFRSSIVHTGQRRLSMKERQLFLDLQGLCRQIIQREAATHLTTT